MSFPPTAEPSSDDVHDGTAEQASLTTKQRELARHALGLPNINRQPYRNHFVTGPGSVDYPAWVEMVEAGMAMHHPGGPLSGGDDIFWLTLKGAEAALDDGERLRSEDFPAAIMQGDATGTEAGGPTPNPEGN